MKTDKDLQYPGHPFADAKKAAMAEGLMRAESLHLVGEKQSAHPGLGILGEICATGAPIYTHDGPPAREPIQFGYPQPDIHSQDIKKQLKAVLRANGMYVGSSKAAALLRELADECDD